MNTHTHTHTCTYIDTYRGIQFDFVSTLVCTPLVTIGQIGSSTFEYEQ